MALVGKFKKNRNKGKKKEPKLKEGEMTFLDHLEELRWHLIRSFAAIVIIGIAIFIYRKWVVDEVILGLLGAEFPTNQLLCFLRGLDGEACAKAVEASLIALSPQEQFLKTIEISLIGGFIVAFPYIIWEFWRFIKPGLHKHEARAVRVQPARGINTGHVDKVRQRRARSRRGGALGELGQNPEGLVE